MKRLAIILLSCLVCAISLAQETSHEVTKFLGIPIDGYKSQMKEKLVSKGFEYDSLNDCFKGEFNGYKVNLFIVTNNNKVWRIMLGDANSVSETDIRIRFNRLCHQFEKNPKYSPRNLSGESFAIPEDEDISYQMTVKNKRYEAAYIQMPEQVDTVALMNKAQNFVQAKYTEEQLDKLSESEKNDILKDLFISFMDEFSKKSVWFMINNDGYNKYSICMFYDNEWNHANGEDL